CRERKFNRDRIEAGSKISTRPDRRENKDVGRRIVPGSSSVDEYSGYRSFRYPACPFQRSQRWALAATFDRVDTFRIKDCMNIKVFQDKPSLAGAAADQAATAIRKAISEKGTARIIAATGASQFEFLDALTAMRDIDWKRVEMF